MGAACFLAVCPTSCLWWPPKESLAKASMAVYVKAVTYKGKPFFFVRMQFGKGSERKELCGPRHVTEEAAKRDKESLDGKPIDEQRAIIQRLKTGEEATPRKRHAKEEATPRKLHVAEGCWNASIASHAWDPSRKGRPQIWLCGTEGWQIGEAQTFFLCPLAN